MGKKVLPQEVVDAATNDYLADESLTLGEAGMPYGVSATTIARELCERGLKTLSKYKTKEEHRMITLLRNHGVTNTDELQKLLNP